MGRTRGIKMAHNQSVQVFGRKKTATAVAYCKRGNGMIKVNGVPIHLVEPRTLSMNYGASAFTWQGTLCWCRYPCPSERGWSCLSDVCYQTSHFKVFGLFLPKICG